MTDKIMELADAYAELRHKNGAPVYNVASGAAYDALAAAIKAEQDYTAAVVSERDELKALMHKALDERDHFIGERDKLTMVHAERTVERDRLREVAQQALYVLENEGITYWSDVQYALRGALDK